jgi:DNA repair protein RadC
MITLKTLDRTPHLAELKVTYKRGRRKDTRQQKMPWALNTAVKAEEYLRTLWDEDTIDLREEFVVLCLDASLTVLGWVRLHTGGLDSSPVDPRLVFGVALQTASAAIVVAHNHPSGNVEPSQQDEVLTQRLAVGAKLLGVRLLDHLILGREGSYSFASAGRLEA